MYLHTVKINVTIFSIIGILESFSSFIREYVFFKESSLIIWSFFPEQNGVFQIFMPAGGIKTERRRGKSWGGEKTLTKNIIQFHVFLSN